MWPSLYIDKYSRVIVLIMFTIMIILTFVIMLTIDMKTVTLTEYAKESVTARGRPSGTATTNTVTPMMMKFT